MLATVSMCAQAEEVAAVKLRHAADLRSQMQSAAARKQAQVLAVRQEGARAREASAVHQALVEVHTASDLLVSEGLLGSTERFGSVSYAAARLSSCVLISAASAF